MDWRLNYWGIKSHSHLKQQFIEYQFKKAFFLQINKRLIFDTFHSYYQHL